VTAESVAERLQAFQESVARSSSSVAAATVGVGWATVELERAALELADALGVPASRFAPGIDSSVLGARCLVADDVLPDGSALVVLEPATEGRMAATLARFGEGPVAIWLAPSEPGEGGEVGSGGGAAWGGALSTKPGGPGPLGVERLIVGGPIHGPHRLLVVAPGTIRS
jgi:hypothetical protein